jgi:hypothetical protein
MKKLLFAAMAALSLVSCTPDHYVRNRVIKLKGVERGSCSAIQVNYKRHNYVLTAAHCEVLKDNNDYIRAQIDDGPEYKLHIKAVSDVHDLMLLEPIPALNGIQIAKSYKMHEEIFSFTHGLGLDTHKSSGEIIQRMIADIIVKPIETQEDKDFCLAKPKYKIVSYDTFFGPVEVCALHVQFLATNGLVHPGSSGGPFVDSDGQLVGIVSGGSDDGFSFIVPAEHIVQFLENIR